MPWREDRGELAHVTARMASSTNPTDTTDSQVLPYSATPTTGMNSRTPSPLPIPPAASIRYATDEM